MIVDEHQMELWVGINWKYGWAPIGFVSVHQLEFRVGINWKYRWALIGIAGVY